MLRLSLTAWSSPCSLRVVLNWVSNSQGPPVYHCELIHDKFEQNTGQEKKVKRFVLAKETALKLQSLLDEVSVMAAPQSFDGSSKGFSYMLKLENGLNSVTYVWCHRPPAGWERLQDIADLIVGPTGNPLIG